MKPQPLTLNIHIFRRTEEGEKISAFIRKQVRDAREEKELSQRELSRKLKRSSAFISQVESGRLELGILDLVALCLELDKPLHYFLPQSIKQNEDGLSDKEWQLVRQFRGIETGAAQEVAIKQVKQLAEMKPKGKK